jgi:hypothetical protein
VYILYRTSPICNPFYVPLYILCQSRGNPALPSHGAPEHSGHLPGSERKRTDEPVCCGSPPLKPFPVCPPANLFPRSTQRVQQMSPPSAQGTHHIIFFAGSTSEGCSGPGRPAARRSPAGSGAGDPLLGFAWLLSHIVSDKRAPRPLLTACLPRATLSVDENGDLEPRLVADSPVCPSPEGKEENKKGVQPPTRQSSLLLTFPRHLIRALGVRHLLT